MTRIRVNALGTANTELARRIYAKRTAARLSLNAAAKQSRIPLATFHRLETKAMLSYRITTLTKLAKWLGCEPRDLVG